MHLFNLGKRVCSFWLVAWAGSTYKDWTWEPAANLTYGSLWLLKMKYARIIKKTNWVTPPVVVQKNKQCKYKLVAHSSMHMNKIKELLKLYTTGTRMMKDLVKQGEEYTEDLSRFYINQEKRKKWKEENNRFEGQNEHVKRQRERSASPEV